jgi:hemerythrin superfamily protein
MSFLDRLAAVAAPVASDEQRADARREIERKAANEPFVAQIVAQHKELETLFTEARNAAPHSASKAARQLATLLTGHSMAEEAAVYPQIVEYSGKTHAGMAFEEHAMTKIQLAKLEALEPQSEQWREKLDHIESAVQQHIYQEESSWLPDLVENAPASVKERLSQRFQEEFERYDNTARSSRTASATGERSQSDTPTQAVPVHDAHKGDDDGVNSQAKTGATGGASAGAPYPNPHSGKADSERKDFADTAMSHGGQSNAAYHGSGQLGSRKTRSRGNTNSGSREK